MRGKSNKLSDTAKQAILEAYKQGIPVSTLAELYNKCSIGPIRAYLYDELKLPHKKPRFKLESRLEPKGDCLVWTGPHSVRVSKRTPSLKYKYVNGRYLKKIKAHLKIETNTKFIGNTCGEYLCVNPNHWTGTRPISERVKEIKAKWELHLKYKTTMQKLASEYGVTKQRIEQIVNG